MKKYDLMQSIIMFVCIPMIVGGILYYLLDPNVIFFRLLHIGYGCVESNCFVRFVRNHFMDMIWSFSLLSSVFIIANRDINRKVLLFVVTIFVVLFEYGQKVGIILGTFDMVDVVLEVVSIMTAYIMVTKKLKGGEYYEG